MITFKTIHKDKKTRARVGELHTPHGIVETPAFVPVGTQATVKSLTPDDLQTIGVQILFGNTYHLHLRPGEEIVEKFGGLGKFMSWSGPARNASQDSSCVAGRVTMTDSGGFQVFSLARASTASSNEPHKGTTFIEGARLASSSEKLLVKLDNERANLVKITEDGVVFKSHLDGSTHTFTPEQSITIQKRLGADIILAFDQCTTYPVTHESAKSDMERTHRWALRSLEVFQTHKLSSPPWEGSVATGGGFNQAIYGIIQGSIFEDLRKESARFITSHPFDGIAIGGVSVGESKKEMHATIDWTVPLLPEDKVRHLLGIGDVDDIFEIIERGIDTFDCVTPSRLGRVGHIFVHPPERNLQSRFRIDVTKSVYATSSEPLSIGCECYVCQNFTRGYIHHLFRARELLAYRLATYHNMHFIVNLTKKIREALLDDRFTQVKGEWLGK